MATQRTDRPEFKTFRIRQIPASWSADRFGAALKRQYGLHTLSTGTPVENNIFNWTIAISGKSREDSFATVTFEYTPDALKLVPEQGFQLDLDGIGLMFDTTFFGLTPLYHPTEKIDIDIIAVTGLAGHAIGSWKARGRPQMWLRDFLPVDIPNARILTHGYDSAVLASSCTASIDDYAKDFLGALRTWRKTNEEMRRPLVFIGHSLGGLIIKKALVNAIHGDELEKQIFYSCYGLMMFGVPNHGIENESLCTMVDGHPNHRLIEDLAPGSQLLRNLHEDFCENFSFTDSKIVSIYETKETKTVIKNEQGQWSRNGKPILMVSKDSATYVGHHTVPYQTMPINQDHSEIAKFHTSSDSDYSKIKYWLLQFTKDASPVIENRFTSVLNDLSEDTIGAIQLRMKHLLQPVDQTADIANLSNQRCDHTGDWLLADADFLSWLEGEQHTTLWLRGCPGVGKTFLMSKVLDHLRREYWHHSITYFFVKDRNQNPERQSLSYIAKTLLYQLLDAVVRICPSDVSSCLYMLEPLINGELPPLFEITLKKIKGHFPRAFLVLDALDECDNEPALQQIVQIFGKAKFKVIVASRNKSGRHLEGNDNPTIIDKCLSTTDMRDDVKLYVQNFVASLAIHDFDGPASAVEKILASSDLFLEMKYILRNLSDNAIDIDQALREVPKDLTSIYNEALKKFKDSSPENLVLRRRVFMWILYAKRPLRFRELADAVSIDIPGNPAVPKLSFIGLDRLCLNLVDFRGQDGVEAIVELAHSTVKDCIQKFVMTTESPQSAIFGSLPCEAEIAHAILIYMNCPRRQLMSGELQGEQFLDYTYRYWIDHLLEDPAPDDALKRLLVSFLESNRCYLWWNSPLSQSTIGTAEQKRHLQARIQGWISQYGTNDQLLCSQSDFMLTQQKQKVATYGKEIGEDHIDTLKAAKDLARMYVDRGDWKLGGKVGEELLARCQRTRADGDTLILEIIVDLAHAYKNQGRWGEVVQIQQQALEISEEFLSPDSRLALITARDLARTDLFLVHLSAAETRLTSVVRSLRRVCGDEDRDTLLAMAYLAKTYRGLKRFDDAEQLHQEIIQLLSTSRRFDDPATLVAQGELACSLIFAGKYQQAYELQTYVVETLTNVLYPDHETTLEEKSNLAFMHLFVRQSSMAITLLESLVESRVRCLGKSHPLTLYTRYHLATIYALKGNLPRYLRNLAPFALHMARKVSHVEVAKGVISNARWAKVKIGWLPEFSVPDFRSMRSAEIDGFLVMGEVPFEVWVALSKVYVGVLITYDRPV